MPGLAPFADALRLPAYCCENCGFWQRHFEPPPSCPLCLDARHVVPKGGWEFLPLPEKQRRAPTHWERLQDGITRFWNDPVTGIGPNAYLIETDGGNLLFEGGAVFSDEALDHIAACGGVAVAAASHPHSYGALWQVQDRFECEVALHPADFAWSAALRVTWPFDERETVLPGLTLHLTAGHFDGHVVLYDERRRILFCGDALKFELDPADRRRALTISAHKAFVRGVPLTHGELRRYRAVFAALDFTQTFTPFEQAANSGRFEALCLLDRLLSGRSHADPIALSDLGAPAVLADLACAEPQAAPASAPPVA